MKNRRKHPQKVFRHPCPSPSSRLPRCGSTGYFYLVNQTVPRSCSPCLRAKWSLAWWWPGQQEDSQTLPALGLVRQGLSSVSNLDPATLLWRWRHKPSWTRATTQQWRMFPSKFTAIDAAIVKPFLWNWQHSCAGSACTMAMPSLCLTLLLMNRNNRQQCFHGFFIEQ